MKILVINCGSSSFKYQIMAMENLEVLCSGLVERIGGSNGRLVHKKYPGQDNQLQLEEERVFTDHAAGMARVMDLLVDPEYGVLSDLSEINGCGHRVVMGGEAFTAPTLVDPQMLETLGSLSALAPLHNPPSIQGMEIMTKFLPCPSVAVFDTEFHSTMPEHAYRYALPQDMYEKCGIRRYGFHGTSHKFVAGRAAEFLGKKPEEINLITCHLGNGSSITAVQGGKCVDTSMGLTPLAGVIMGTRCGDIDPAIHAFLAKQTGMSLSEIDDMLNKKSGLLGLCGMNDMRDIHAAREKGDRAAELAFEMFCYSIKKYIGSYYAALGSVDALVFTAGIGENDNLARAGICSGLERLGIAIDQAANDKRSGEARRIGLPGMSVEVLVIPTNEELAIATATMKVLSA